MCCRLRCWFNGASLQHHSDSINVLQRMNRCRMATFLLQHWTVIIKLVVKFMNFLNEGAHCVSKWAWNCLCVTTTLLVSVRNNTGFMYCSTVFLCQPSCVNWRMSRSTTTLAHLGRVRIYLHDLMCYHFTKHHSLHGWIINTTSIKKLVMFL
jgi:hypothetical protein